MEHRCTVLMSEFVTHDVKRFIIERPAGFSFTPGQGVELAIDKDSWRDEGRPFTPTSLPDDKVLEFTIKGYPEHQGVTQELHRLRAGESLLMSEPFGTIHYRGPGVFIAGGAGITPFIAILRDLERRGELGGNSLLFTNKTANDIICEKELKALLKEDARFICSQSGDCRCTEGRINREYIEKSIDDFSQRFYICGPPPFVEAMNEALVALGATPDTVVFEQ